LSTIRVDNFGPSAGGTTYSARGIAKAWVNFNGTGTIAARDSENVSSLTDNGTGDYTVNFSNALADANYRLGASRGTTTGNARGVGSALSKTAAALRFDTVYVSSLGAVGTNIDDSEVDAVVFGDLA
jgi:hypothetical protein